MTRACAKVRSVKKETSMGTVTVSCPAWCLASLARGFQLIEVREKSHPADVIRPYRDLIEIGLDRASDKYRYPKAIKTIRRLRDSYRRAGDEAGFIAYVADLRQRHHRKTSFITKLDKALVRH